MSILGDTVDMADAWKNGEWEFKDITAPIAVGQDLLSAAIDPIAVLIAAPIGQALDFAVHHCKHLKEPLARLEGSDELVAAQKNAWLAVSKDFVAAGNAHADGAGDLPSWTGDASQTYHDLLKKTNETFQAVARACEAMGIAVEAAGILVGMARGFVWDMITKVLTEIVEKIIIALAAAFPTFGAALAAIAGWVTAKVGSLMLWITRQIQKVLDKAQEFAHRTGLLTEQVDKACEHAEDIAQQLLWAKALKGRKVTDGNIVRGDPSKGQVADPYSPGDAYHTLPKDTMPGDTTVGTRLGIESKAGDGPIEGGYHGPWSHQHWDEIAKDKLGDKAKDALKDLGGKTVRNTWIQTHDDDIRDVE